MRIDQVWRYPVKSLLGGRVAAAEVQELGIVGDRQWTLRDESRGAIASMRKVAGLARLAARDEGGAVVIDLPDGSSLQAGDPDANERLSAAVGHPVSLWSMQSDADFWLRGTPDSADFLEELRSVFGRLEDEPLPDLTIFPPVMMTHEYPPGAYHDAFPLMLMSTSALAALRAALPDSAIDERRFRPSMVIDTGDADGHPEFGWVGRRLRLGEVEVEIGAPCPRCVAVTREFADDLPADRAVLRHVVRDLGQAVGVYATVTRPGVVRVGDPVELV